jgi:hypothetical protein
VTPTDPHGDGGVPEAGGVDLQPDVERIHRAIQREPRDPIEGREPAPGSSPRRLRSRCSGVAGTSADTAGSSTRGRTSPWRRVRSASQRRRRVRHRAR